MAVYGRRKDLISEKMFKIRGPISLAPEVFSCVRLDASVLGAKPEKPRTEIFS